MKISVLKASKILAEIISNEFLDRVSLKGKSLFVRKEIEYGFEIATNKGVDDIVVFRYTNENKREKIEYDDRLISFPE